MFSLHEILMDSIKSGASDVHIGIGIYPILRINGKLISRDQIDAPSKEDMDEVISTMMSHEQIKKFNSERECDFSFDMHYNTTETQRFRANFSFSRGNPVLALRVISPNIRTIKQLCLPDAVKDVTAKNNGLFLVTGPTGSGKSTTLAAMINEINMTRQVHIITVEDPVEYIYTSDKALIHQREVGSDTQNFAEALRRAMRQDPDVILIGEMRDLETISAAITAAETGHLVFATLHTPDAPQSIDRIIDVFPPYQQQQIRIQLSSTLIGVLSQQLVPVISGLGRLVATEFMIANNAIRNQIREAKTAQIYNTIQTNSTSGMHSMDQDLARMVNEKLINRKTAVEYANDARELERNLG